MNTPAKKFEWLLRRELWEHKGMVVWAQLVVAAIIFALVAGALLLGQNMSYSEDGVRLFSMREKMMDESVRQVFSDMAPQMYLVTAAPLYIMLGFLVFFYCLGALHDDRRDRSLLFWKSLPVSDHMTVLSKVAVALVVTPAVTMLIGTALSLGVILLLCLKMAFMGVNAFGALLSSPEFYLAPVRALGLLPVYALWALPTVGWLLMVSSWARSKVFLWAVGVPLGAAVLIAWTNRIFALGWNSGWFMEHIVARILGGVAPGVWFAFSRIEPGEVVRAGGKHQAAGDLFLASWGTLATGTLWAGVAAGVAMIAVAVWMRRWREEG
ncbi:hypothetical protein [Pseudoduganella namucuonensis]|uniref:ABC-2 type transport system permease protein n=1 Tax=Pseudoduganella namucuonensis TaxID=1035707 RepID=A0A1I7K5V6_9BURK|nr:hypothetical protein [Pseudoduganella namucuonensis]SFU92815.1 ABC-2 type transport system permease protein [Pseudoduganella namucuonensis]